MDTFLLDEQLRAFLQEDLEHGDITTDAIFTDQDQAQVCLRAREPLLAAGMQVAARVFTLLERDFTILDAVADGQQADRSHAGFPFSLVKMVVDGTSVMSIL